MTNSQSYAYMRAELMIEQVWAGKPVAAALNANHWVWSQAHNSPVLADWIEGGRAYKMALQIKPRGQRNCTLEVRIQPASEGSTKEEADRLLSELVDYARAAAVSHREAMVAASSQRAKQLSEYPRL